MTCTLVIITATLGFVAGAFARPFIDEQSRRYERRELPPDDHE